MCTCMRSWYVCMCVYVMCMCMRMCMRMRVFYVYVCVLVVVECWSINMSGCTGIKSHKYNVTRLHVTQPLYP